MAGCLNITSLELCHVLKPFIFFLIINISPIIAFKVKNKKEEEEERKEGRL